MRKKRVFATVAVLMAVCTAAYAVNMQGLLMNAGIEWMGNTLRVFYPIDLDNGWKIEGTAVATDAAELNALSGTGLSAAELGVLDGVTPGTSAASSAVVLDDKGAIDALDITALSVDGEDVTSIITGITPGTAAPSKAVVLGGTGKIDTIDVTSLSLNGTAVTATAAAINGFMGSGLTGAEVGYLSGSTAGTLVPEKCVVVDALGAIDALDVTSLSLGTFAVTASAAELNYLAGLTPGTAAASQAVVLGITGEIDALDITALTLNGTLVNATATELDTLSAVVAGTLTPEKALVVDAAGQISALDIVSPSINGVALLATATELDVLAGVTPGTLTAEKAVVVDAAGTIDTLDVTALSLGTTVVTATAAELDYLAGLTPGTRAVSQAIVVDAAGTIDALDVTALSLGTTAVTATAAELNVLAGLGLDAIELGYVNGATAGVATANKVVVLGATGKIDTIDVTALELNGTSLTASAGDLNAVTGNVTAVQAQVNAVKVVRTFTETATAGTYTATVDVPAGYTVVDVRWINSAVWNNTTSATMDVGDDDDPDGYLDGVDLKTVPAAGAQLSTLLNAPGGSYGLYCGTPKAYAAAKTITATVVTVHNDGDLGRSTLIVEMVKTANCVAAASKA